MTKLETITEILKTRFIADIEIREGSFLPDFRNIAFGGARIFDLDGEELVVSVNLVSYTGITLLDFEIDGVRYGGKFVKETAAEKLARETLDLKAELAASGKPFEIDYHDHTFEFGQQVFVSRSVPMPARFGDDVVVVARPYNTKYQGRVQRYHFDGDHYLVIVKPDDFRDTFEEWKADQKARKKAAKAEARNAAKVKAAKK